VAAWIAVAFDLIDKIRELALSGDNVAKDLLQTLEKYIRQLEEGNEQGLKSALRFESEILETCRDKLGLFDRHQYSDITRLKEDRHKCAHPTLQVTGEPYAPSAEQARVHLRNAVEHVLKQPPVRGKSAIDALCKLVASKYFPQDIEAARVQLEAGAFERPSDALVCGFLDRLIYGFLDKDDALFYKRQALAAINSVSRMYPKLAEDRLRKQLNKLMMTTEDSSLVGVMALLANLELAGAVMNAATVQKAKNFIAGGAADLVVPGLGKLYELEDLQQAVAGRIAELDVDELAQAITIGLPKANAKERSLHLLKESRSWARTNRIINTTLLPVIEHLNADDVRRIVRMPSEEGADLVGATSLSTLFNRIREMQIIGAEEFNALLSENGLEFHAMEEDS
jgi:hypothetical protein